MECGVEDGVFLVERGQTSLQQLESRWLRGPPLILYSLCSCIYIISSCIILLLLESRTIGEKVPFSVQGNNTAWCQMPTWDGKAAQKTPNALPFTNQAKVDNETWPRETNSKIGMTIKEWIVFLYGSLFYYWKISCVGTVCFALQIQLENLAFKSVKNLYLFGSLGLRCWFIVALWNDWRLCRVLVIVRTERISLPVVNDAVIHLPSGHVVHPGWLRDVHLGVFVMPGASRILFDGNWPGARSSCWPTGTEPVVFLSDSLMNRCHGVQVDLIWLWMTGLVAGFGIQCNLWELTW